MIQQTLAKNSNEPILWYDSEGVDFGSFKESVYMKNEEETLSFSFTFTKINVNNPDLSHFLLSELRSMEITPWPKSVSRYYYKFNQENSYKQTEIKIKISISKNKYTHLYVTFDDKIIEYNFENSYVAINNEVVIEMDQLVPKKSSRQIIPSLVYFENSKYDYLLRLLSHKLVRLIFRNVNSRVENETIYKIIDTIRYVDNKKDFLINIVDSKTPKSIRNEIYMNIDAIYDLLVILNTTSILESINMKIESFFSNVAYIAPIRATAQRYYRIQGLSVLDVDSMGNNVPMILYSMTNEEKKQWITWTTENFDISFNTENKTGHTEVKVKTKIGEYNLADTGFGYSQLLPVLLVIWKQLQVENDLTDTDYLHNSKKKPVKTIIIEQPELHLHPAMQSQIADLLIKIINITDDINFIIETHSVVMINRIGEHIEESNTNLESKINIFLVNPSANQNISSTKYDENGIIEEWPIGFLSGGIL